MKAATSIASGADSFLRIFPVVLFRTDTRSWLSGMRALSSCFWARFISFSLFFVSFLCWPTMSVNWLMYSSVWLSKNARRLSFFWSISLR